MKVCFVLTGQGGELDRQQAECRDEDDLNTQFGDWVDGVIVSVGDTITIEAVNA